MSIKLSLRLQILKLNPVTSSMSNMDLHLEENNLNYQSVIAGDNLQIMEN